MRPELRDAAFTLLGGGALMFVIGRLLVRLEPELVSVKPAQHPSGPDVTPNAGPPPVPTPTQGPLHLISAELPLVPGSRYAAAVSLSGFLIRTLATVDKVRREAENQGFSNVVVTQGEPPPGSPPLSSADYFVLGTYQGAPKSLGRDQGGGAVHIADAWKLT